MAVKNTYQVLKQICSHPANANYIISQHLLVPLIHHLADCIANDNICEQYLFEIVQLVLENANLGNKEVDQQVKDEIVSYLVSSMLFEGFRDARLNPVKLPLDVIAMNPIAVQKGLQLLLFVTQYPQTKSPSTMPVYQNRKGAASNVERAIVSLFNDASLCGIIPILASLLLANGPLRFKQNHLSGTVLTITLLCIKILNNLALLNLDNLQVQTIIVAYTLEMYW